jgi:predicted nucleic acid-binding protein
MMKPSQLAVESYGRQLLLVLSYNVSVRLQITEKLELIMTIPTAIFIDTTVFDSQHYNYDNTVLSSFAKATQDHDLKLLLPDPTLREIRRHLVRATEDAVKSLMSISGKTPWLKNWKAELQQDKRHLEISFKNMAKEQWETFLSQFQVEHLSYEGIDIKTIMDWYDKIQAPFSSKKPKEFPDALALASIIHYSSSRPGVIAVVSADRDMKLACDRFDNLVHFSSLQKLTELLLLTSEQIVELREAVSNASDLLVDSICSPDADCLNINYNCDGFGIDEIEYDDVLIRDLSIVGVGENECVVVFEADVEVSLALHTENWDDPFSNSYPARANKDVPISGTAKLTLGENREVIELKSMHVHDSWVHIGNDDITDWG